MPTLILRPVATVWTRLLSFVLSLTVLLLAVAPVAATVRTDQADYAPGSVVTISGDNSNGAGYLPGETVDVVVSGPNGYAASCSAVADEAGAWSCQVTLWNSALAVGDYSYTATGQTSGVSESGTFTDAINVATTTSLNLSSTSVTLGNSVLLSGALAATSGSDPAVPAGQTVHLNRYSGSTCPGGGTTLVADVTTANPGGTFGPQSYTPSAAGTIYFRAVFDGANNGLSGASGVTWQQSISPCVALTVNAAPATVNTTTTASNASATYGASSVTLNATVTPASGPAVNTGTVMFTVNGNSVTSGTVSGGSASASLPLAGFTAGTYNIAATYNAGSGFNGSNNSSQSPVPTLAIGQASSTVTVVCTAGAPYTYTGSAQTPCTATATGVGMSPVDVTASLVYANNTNAGSATADASWGGDTNHTGNTGSGGFAINKADPSCSVTGYDVTYDANPHTATGSCAGVPDETTPLAAIDLSGTTHTNAGSYPSDPWSFTDVSGNYLNDSGTVADNIDQAEVTGIFTVATKIFDGNTSATILTRSLSGVISPDSCTLSGGTTAFPLSSVGTHTLTLTGWSLVGADCGNYVLPADPTTSASITAWNAAGYGFYQPVGVENTIFTAAPASAPATNTGEPWNLIKGGSTVPLKFNVFAGTVEKTSLSDIQSFDQAKLSSCGNGAAGEDPVEIVTTGGTTLRYDGTAGQWIQNWKTPKVIADTCYRAWVTFADGSSLEAFFKLRK